MTSKSFAGFSSALAALLIALVTAYVAFDRKLTDVADASVTTLEVEHLIDLKTNDRLAEIQRSLERIERNIERLQVEPPAR